MLVPLTEHQLLLFWLQLALLVAVARGLGGLCRRHGQPAVIGELAAGLLLGPTVLGRVAPRAFQFLLPDDPVQGGALLAISWLGVAFLLVVAGFETDLKLVASLGRGAMTVSLGSLLLPLAGGIALGLALPDSFQGSLDLTVAFALFFGIALAVSALPVIAKILIDLQLMRRDVGQVTIAAGIANDLVGYLGIGVLAGIVTGGGFDPVGLAVTLALVAGFTVLALTVGQRAVDGALRFSRRPAGGDERTITVLILTVLVFGAATQAIGVEAVLGAFLAGLVLGQSRYFKAEVRHGFESLVSAFFAPVFFATAGLSVDLGLLFEGQVLRWAVIAVAVAAVTKVVGGWAGALAGGMPGRMGLAIGVGLNARGAIGVIVAAIGLGLGVLNQTSYTVVVVISIATSLMAPPLLRAALAGLEASSGESARLEREAVLKSSMIANTRAALLPTRGGTNSVLAGRLLDLALQPEASVTIVTAHQRGDQEAKERARPAVDALLQVLHGRKVERTDVVTDEVVQSIIDEAALGYGLVAIGMSEDFKGGHALSPLLRDLLSRSPVPLLLVRHGEGVDPNEPLPFRRLLVPATGTDVNQAAQEVAFVVAGRLGAEVHVVHVVARPDKEPLVAVAEGANIAVGTLEEAQRLAARFGQEVRVEARAGSAAGPEIARVAAELDADALVLGARLRNLGGQPFLGHSAEYLLEHTSRTVIAMVAPAKTST